MDLYDVLEDGYEPEFKLRVQIFDEEDAKEFDFDILDPTKIVPESEVPVRPIGKMVLNETPDNFFAEVEQVAFHPGNVVPGIDFSNDPLLQGRLFSYQDTQLNRFGSANWDEIPINRPVAERHNNQRAGFMRQEINEGKASYKPNSIGDDYPEEAPEEEGGYEHYAEKIEGKKIRNRSESFQDHFSQARLFWNSMTEPEKQNIVDAAHFELGKVNRVEIRKRMVYNLFNNVDHEFAKYVAEGIGIEPPEEPGGEHVDALLKQGNAKHFVAEMFKHKKPIAASGAGTELLESVELPGVVMDPGGKDLESAAETFVDAIAQHRHWERDPKEVPA